MKIGIMTMQRIPNYGSFMQALSLKKIIESLGHQVVFVDYTVEPDIEHRNSNIYKLKYFVKMMNKHIKGTIIGHYIYCLVKKNDINKQNIFFSCHNMLGVSNKYHFRTKVDVLVIGSDEVFNCLQPGFNVGYSLELFGKNNNAKRVITYAASFGNTTIDRLEKYGIIEELGKLINNMSAVSVRDDNSLNIIKSISNKEVKIHLDPVLISNIELEHWKNNYLKDYVILYGYRNRFTETECEKIMKFAHSKQCMLISIGEPQIKYDKYICCRPDEILGYFKNASYIITDTFHGTIFSIIMHKKFLTIARPSLDGMGGNEEKIYSLMKYLGLNSRLVIDFDNIEKNIEIYIDYKNIDYIRTKERIKSLKYLSYNIN